MFEVQWWATATKLGVSRKSYGTQTKAELCAQGSAHQYHAILRVVEQPSGRVVAVFGSSGKRLTFPIATAIAYVALAQAIAAASLLHKEHKP